MLSRSSRPPHMPHVGLPHAGAAPEVPWAWPNPGTDVLHLRSEHSGPATFQLLDLNGCVKHQGKLHHGTTKVDTSTLPAGVYLLRVIDDTGGPTTMKWVKSE